MCVLERDLDESFYIAFSQHVDRAIKKSNNSNLFMAGLVLIGYLAYTQELEDSYLERMIERLTKAHTKLCDKQKDQKILDEYYNKVLLVIKHQLDQSKEHQINWQSDNGYVYCCINICNVEFKKKVLSFGDVLLRDLARCSLKRRFATCFKDYFSVAKIGCKNNSWIEFFRFVASKRLSKW